MEVRFYIDPETDEPHIHEHGIMEDEVLQVAFELNEKAKKAFRRRQKRKPK